MAFCVPGGGPCRRPGDEAGWGSVYLVVAPVGGQEMRPGGVLGCGHVGIDPHPQEQ